MLLYLHCERNGETENNITEIQERLAQVYGASQPPLRIKQVPFHSDGVECTLAIYIYIYIL